MAPVWGVPEREHVPQPRRPERGRLDTLRMASRRLSHWVVWTAAAIPGLLILVWILSYAIDGPLTRYMQGSVNQLSRSKRWSARRSVSYRLRESSRRTYTDADTGCSARCRYPRMTDLSVQMIAVGRADGDRGRSGGALVAVVKPADFGDCDDPRG